MKKRISMLLIIAAALVSLSACSKTSANIENTNVEETEDEKKPVEAQKDEESEVIFEESEDIADTSDKMPDDQTVTVSDLNESVINNAHYFVKVGDRVYFREYGKRALENPTVFGHYLLNPTGDHSYIDYYDETVCETVQAFEDFGYGKIVYMDGIFFMNGLDYSSNDYGEPYIYAVDMDGKEVKLPELMHGTIKEVSGDNKVLFIERNYDGNEFKPEISGITSDGSRVFTIESENYLDFIDVVDDYLIYAESIYDTNCNTSKIWCKNIYTGEKVCITEVEYDYVEAINYGEIFTSNDKKYIPVIIRAGSGNMFQRGSLIGFVPGEADSGYEAAEYYADENDIPYVSINSVEKCYNDTSDDTYYLVGNGINKNADLYIRKSTGEQELVVKDFILAADYYDSRNDMTLAECVDGQGYIMYATHIYDEEGSIGWRDGFRLQKMEYLRLNGEGSYDIIQTVFYE